MNNGHCCGEARYGYRRIHVVRQRESWLANHKRIWRLYSNTGLSVGKRRRKRIAAVERKLRPIATGPNQSWLMGFVSGGLAYGRRFRCLNKLWFVSMRHARMLIKN
ncbi:IS3 family transposase [Cupriavidus plantarum]|uniref:IS3 family transposase n=1 Tax=Cupriavidus plantarum TaxID=942865 RepID=UPI000E24B123|nr:IS3 family transposase [Cupriavidus plantarum]REE93794.1 helix-turn-helix protein [Cupriavidus plantarum]